MTQCQITVITLTSPQAATSWLVGGLKSAYCGWSASYSTQLPEIKIKKHAEKYVDCCQEKKLTMSIV